MARIRTIKPEFFCHEELFDLEIETGLPVRIAYAGLWCHADREGRFKWRPRTLKSGVLPFDDIDFSRVLDALTTRGFIMKYTVSGTEYGLIPRFKDHQVINNRESDSVLPPPDITIDSETTSTREARVNHASTTRGQSCIGEGKGKEGKGKEGESSVPDKKRFSKPTLEEVRTYCLQRGNQVNPQQWYDHYESNGWRVGKNPMKSWQAAIRTWENNGIAAGQPKETEYENLSRKRP